METLGQNRVSICLEIATCLIEITSQKNLTEIMESLSCLLSIFNFTSLEKKIGFLSSGSESHIFPTF